MERTKTIEIETDSQLRRCLAVRREVFILGQNVPEEREVDGYDRIGSGATHRLLLYGHADAAAGRYIPYEDGAVKMQRIAVRSAYRGQGLGRILMEALEESARRVGFRRSVLDSQCHAEAFYRSLGYRTIPGEPFEEAGILHVRMEKDL